MYHFHGGCTGCTLQDESIGHCAGCCYMEQDFTNYPDKNPFNKAQELKRQKMIRLAKKESKKLKR